MIRARLSALHTAVFSALGIGSLVNCGGVSEHSDEPNGLETATGGVGGTSRNLDVQRCTDPTPVVINVDGQPAATGFVSCAGDWLHREQRTDCPSLLPRPEAVEPVESGCTSDADCTDYPEGQCYRVDPNPSFCGAPSGRFVGRCYYGCVRDDDCESGMICLCGVPSGQCVPSDCGTDADCAGTLCASVGSRIDTTTGYLVAEGFACQTASDECMSSADCPRGSCTQARTCQEAPNTSGVGGTCGRPFLVGGEARTADVLGGSGSWSRSTNPDVRNLSSAARVRLAEHWTSMARMEHASVAAFARFTLELISLGAPAELVEAAQRAMSDEIEHARLCFGLASAYAGRAVGPGPLAVDGALDNRSFETIVRTAILEACVGETLAAVEAEDAAERATDPEVQSVLARIACDEARHAELGFQFLAWALARAEPELRERLAGALADAARAELVACALTARSGGGLAGHGMPSEAERRSVRALALREIVEPAARSLTLPDPARAA